MEQSYKKIFWGFLITIFDINLGPVNILPDFLGFLIISSGLMELITAFENINFKTAKRTANFLAFYSIAVFVLFSMFLNFDYKYKLIAETGSAVLTGILNIIMAFHILAGTIDYYLSKDKQGIANDVYRSQKKYTLLQIFCLLAASASINISNEALTIASIIFMLAVQIYFAAIISSISKLFNEDIIES